MTVHHSCVALKDEIWPICPRWIVITLLFFFFLLLELFLVCYQPLLKSLFLKYPIVHKIEVEVLSDKGLPKHRDDLLVVRPFFEL